AYHNTPDTYFSNEIAGFKYQRLVTNPAYTATNGQPQLIHADYVGLVQATPGGIITGGPLKGVYFVGPNATPLIFNYGNVSSNFYTNGGTPNYGITQGDLGVTAAPSSSKTFFGSASFDLTDSITASLQYNYGEFRDRVNSYSTVQYGTLTINSDNPFLPASI